MELTGMISDEQQIGSRCFAGYPNSHCFRMVKHVRWKIMKTLMKRVSNQYTCSKSALAKMNHLQVHVLHFKFLLKFTKSPTVC